ncbi:Cobalt-precorrin-7 (C5)-methyltransferase / Cobalt-precorrin-6B C15-methyltransferase [decarboxylating], partial [hydrothermal vent metagenome]
MTNTNKISIIGVLDNGLEGLTPAADILISQADVVFGGVRTLTLFEKHFPPHAQQIDLIAHFGKMPQLIKDALNDHLKVVVLATGDPLCHGVARYLINKLSAETCEVHPNVSTIQLAFARFGLAWQGVSICSVHTKDAGEWTLDAGPEHGLYPLVESVRNNELIALFTSPENTPDRIARMLSQLGL